ncbi:hypothetical protein Ga0609869_001788 [Rhodovulum iodosum]|uniref:DUF6473 domain-containing protein n=1 Tax=Rhodovulum iodosum TaxID=68291 RepID=A0ABV3XSX2_9RHOB|nr:DUF6473 family protein [Rhodovulum robiginosum]RSK39645.1 hypothetical protein EJA01_01025 [Rhodovulum robiginosum]
MTYDVPILGKLDYAPCRYGQSKLEFRGPARAPAERFVAALGGTETFGKFVALPFPALLEQEIGADVVNLGSVNAGLDSFIEDSAVLALADEAAVRVLQVLGAQNMSNRFYSVHPRRNDRFVRASPLLAAIYPEVDFTEFHFTGHLLTVLRRHCPDRFGIVLAELKTAWTARMRRLGERMAAPTVLLWLGERAPEDAGQGRELCGAPLLVDDGMLDSLRPHFADIVVVRPSAAARGEGTCGMVYPRMSEAAAEALPGPAIHAETALALAPAVRRLMG